MRHEALKVLLRHLYEVGVERGDYMPLLLWGEAGVGKSSAVREVAAELFGIPTSEPMRLAERFRDVRVGQLDPVDLIGVPREREVRACPWCGPSGQRFADGEMVQHVRVRHPDQVLGRSNVELLEDIHEVVQAKMPSTVEFRMVFTMPNWFPQAGQRPGDQPGGFLFLDETNRGNKEVMQAIFQLLLDRRLHKSELPRGWIVIGAVNPHQSFTTADAKTSTSDFRGVQNDMLWADKAMRSRFMHIALEPTAEEWLNYAADRGLSRIVRAAVAKNPELLGRLHARIPEGIVPNPRTWVLYDKISKGLEKYPDVLMEVQLGMIGTEAATGLTMHESLPMMPLEYGLLRTYLDGDKEAMLKIAETRRKREAEGASPAELDRLRAKEAAVSSPARRRMMEIWDRFDEQYVDQIAVLSMRTLIDEAQKISEEEEWLSKPARSLYGTTAYECYVAVVLDGWYDGHRPDLIVNLMNLYWKTESGLRKSAIEDPRWSKVILQAIGEVESLQVGADKTETHRSKVSGILGKIAARKKA